MDDLTALDRAFETLEVCEASGNAIEKWQEITSKWDGLVLTGVSDDVRQRFESFGVSCNIILDGYVDADSAGATDREIETTLEESDAARLVQLAEKCAIDIRDAETNRILEQLRHNDGVLPAEEIIEARRHQDWFTPLLISECRAVIDRVVAGESSDDNDGATSHNSIPFFSLLLFAEWSRTESVGVVLQASKLPGEGPFKLFGDAIHEHLPRYFAQFLHGEVERVDEIIRNPNCNVYVRWAAVSSYKYLVRDGVLAVDEATCRLERLFDETKIVGETGRAGWGHPYELSAGIVDTIVSIDGTSVSRLTPADFEFVDESIIPREEFLPNSAPGEPSISNEELQSLPATVVKDCLQELRHWAAFNRSRDSQKKPMSPDVGGVVKPVAIDPPAPKMPPPKSTTVRSGKRIPRNAKCPCGSGKKYKQCCLRKRSDESLGSLN